MNNSFKTLFFHVNNTVTTTPHSSVMINYHTTLQGSYILYTTAIDHLFLEAKRVEPKITKWSTKGLKNANQSESFANERYICFAKIDGLSSGKYIYKIVSCEKESDIFSFVIEEARKEFEFIMLADMQYGNNQITHELVNKIKTIAPKASLIVGSGDLVDYGDQEDEWSSLFDNQLFDGMMLAFAPGDHEYWGEHTVKYTQYEVPHTYLSIMHYPLNGASICKGSNYYFKYQNILFVALDMNDSNQSKGIKFDEQVKWFIKTLEELRGSYDFLVVLEHKSLFGSTIIDSAVAKNLTPMWYPLFNKYHVNLVLSGHDHIYSRTYPLEGLTPKANDKGTIYLDLGSSGNKRRNVDTSLLYSELHAKVIDLKEQDTSLGAIVKVIDKEMLVKVYNLLGEVVDEFVIQIE